MALVVNKKEFALGALLTVTFVILLFIMHTTRIVSIKGKSLAHYTDEMFVSVSKGSVYFVPDLSTIADKYKGKSFDVKIKKNEQAALLFEKANATVELTNDELKIKGDLGEILKNVLKDADAVFKGEDKEVYHRYGYAGKKVIHQWWLSLKEIEDAYKKAKKFDEIKLLKTVRIKALEPAFNFYGIEAKSASHHALGISGIIVFYVIYTVWWGYAIYFLCEGVGLLMKNFKEKTEA
ncbi:MAG: hypothetical protein JRE28_12830 [Deltaproteobacteria bacterium]|nr:hypothetical protein [Deltaproteobacteria bacterium]